MTNGPPASHAASQQFGSITWEPVAAFFAANNADDPAPLQWIDALFTILPLLSSTRMTPMQAGEGPSGQQQVRCLMRTRISLVVLARQLSKTMNAWQRHRRLSGLWPRHCAQTTLRCCSDIRSRTTTADCAVPGMISRGRSD